MTYTLIQQLDDQFAHLKFTGPFQGKTVTWDTHFFTLDAYIANENVTNMKHKQVIDIQPLKRDTLKLTVALNINKVNKPNIQK